jgi:predicted nucleic acid-binding protein
MGLVPEPSALLALALEGEDADYACAVAEAIAREGAIVPALFWFELREALLVGERRKRLPAERTAAFLGDVAVLNIVIDDLPSDAAVFELARKHTLTFLDAAYLEVASGRGARLATLDGALAKAAKRAGMGVFVGGV